MKKWKVLYNPMAGYMVYKIKREDEPMHSGNIIIPKGVSYRDGENGKAWMEDLAAVLNEEEEVRNGEA